MSDWFFMLGEALEDSERQDVKAYLRGLDIEEMPIANVRDWNEARRIISHPQWDRRWWDAEQSERRRLQEKAAATGTNEWLASLSQTLERATEPVHGAAAIEGARRGCMDPGLIRAAAGAASEALYLSELARIVGEDEGHVFRLKQSLFAGGHWPLGIVDGRYYVF